MREVVRHDADGTRGLRSVVLGIVTLCAAIFWLGGVAAHAGYLDNADFQLPAIPKDITRYPSTSFPTSNVGAPYSWTFNPNGSGTAGVIRVGSGQSGYFYAGGSLSQTATNLRTTPYYYLNFKARQSVDGDTSGQYPLTVRIENGLRTPEIDDNPGSNVTVDGTVTRIAGSTQAGRYLTVSFAPDTFSNATQTYQVGPFKMNGATSEIQFSASNTGNVDEFQIDDVELVSRSNTELDEVNHTFNVPFNTTSVQSFFGAGAPLEGDLPTIVLGVNKFDTGNINVGGFFNLETPSIDLGLVTIPSISLGTFGAEIAGHFRTEGIGIGLTPHYSAGTVEVNYPVNFQMSQPTYIAGGGVVPIKAWFTVDPSAKVTTVGPTLSVKADFRLNWDLAAQLHVQAFSTDLFNGSIIPSFLPSFLTHTDINYPLFTSTDFVNLLGNAGVVTDHEAASLLKKDFDLPTAPKTEPPPPDPTTLLTITVAYPFIKTEGQPGQGVPYDRVENKLDDSDLNGVKRDIKDFSVGKLSYDYIALDPPDSAKVNPATRDIATYGRDKSDILSLNAHLTNMIAYALGAQTKDTNPFDFTATIPANAKDDAKFKVEFAFKSMQLDALAGVGLLQDATFYPQPIVVISAYRIGFDAAGNAVAPTTKTLVGALTIYPTTTIPSSGMNLRALNGGDLHMPMPSDADPTPSLQLEANVVRGNTFQGRTYLTFSGGIEFTPLNVEASVTAGGLSLPSMSFKAVPTISTSATLPILLSDNSFKIDLGGNALQAPYTVVQKDMPIPSIVDWKVTGIVGATPFSPVDDTLANVYVVPSGGQSGYKIEGMGDFGPLPGQKGSDGGTTTLVLDKGISSVNNGAGIALSTNPATTNATGTIDATTITPGVHHLTAIAKSSNETGIFTHESTTEIEFRYLTPLTFDLYDGSIPDVHNKNALIDSITAGTPDNTLVIRAENYYPGISTVYVDGQPVETRSLVDNSWPLNYGTSVPESSTSPNRGYLAFKVFGSLLANGGIHRVEIITPGPGGGKSYALVPFTLPNRYVYSPQLLRVRNPQPIVTSLTPTSFEKETGNAQVLDATTGIPVAGRRVLHINGFGFTPASVVLIDGQDIDALSKTGQKNDKISVVQFEDPQNIRVELPNESTTEAGVIPLLSRVGSHKIVVTNPTQAMNPVTEQLEYIGGGASGPATFAITHPTPVLSRLDTGKTASTSGLVFRGSPPVPLNIYAQKTDGAGRAFIAPPDYQYTINNDGSRNYIKDGNKYVLVPGTGATATFNGVAKTVTFPDLDTTQPTPKAEYVTIQLTSGDLAQTGSFPVVVTNPGGKVSLPLIFKVIYPRPVVDNLIPASVAQRAAGTTLLLSGRGFYESSTVQLNGAQHSYTYLSPTRIQITLGASDVQTAGSLNVTVTNPQTAQIASNPDGFDGGTSVAKPLTITANTSGAGSITVTQSTLAYNLKLQQYVQTVTLTNVGTGTVNGPITLTLVGLKGATVTNAQGTNGNGPYFQSASGLASGAKLVFTVNFQKAAGTVPIAYTPLVTTGP